MCQTRRGERPAARHRPGGRPSPACPQCTDRSREAPAWRQRVPGLVALALAVVVPAAAAEPRREGSDGARHFAMSALVALHRNTSSCPLDRDTPLGRLKPFGAAVVAGLGRGVYERGGDEAPSAEDMGWNLAGAAIGHFIAQEMGWFGTGSDCPPRVVLFAQRVASADTIQALPEPLVPASAHLGHSDGRPLAVGYDLAWQPSSQPRVVIAALPAAFWSKFAFNRGDEAGGRQGLVALAASGIKSSTALATVAME